MKKSNVAVIVILSVVTTFVALACLGFILEGKEDKVYNSNYYSNLNLDKMEFTFVDDVPKEAKDVISDPKTLGKNFGYAKVTFQISNIGNKTTQVSVDDFYLAYVELPNDKTSYISKEDVYPQPDENQYSGDGLHDEWVLPADSSKEYVFYVVADKNGVALNGKLYLPGLPTKDNSYSMDIRIPVTE